MLLYYNKCGGKPVEANEAGLQLILVQLGNKNQSRDAVEQLVSTSGKAQAGPVGERREGYSSMQYFYLLVPTQSNDWKWSACYLALQRTVSKVTDWNFKFCQIFLISIYFSN